MHPALQPLQTHQAGTVQPGDADSSRCSFPILANLWVLGTPPVAQNTCSVAISCLIEGTTRLASRAASLSRRRWQSGESKTTGPSQGRLRLRWCTRAQPEKLPVSHSRSHAAKNWRETFGEIGASNPLDTGSPPCSSVGDCRVIAGNEVGRRWRSGSAWRLGECRTPAYRLAIENSDTHGTAWQLFGDVGAAGFKARDP